MSEQLADLPIVEELGAQLVAGFRRRERGGLCRPAARIAVLAAAAALGAGVVLLTQLGGGGPSAASAAQVLQTAARAAAAWPAHLAKPRQFFFVRWRTSVLLPIRRGATGLVPLKAFYGPHALVTIEEWNSWSFTRKGRTQTRVLGVSFPTAASRARWVAIGRPALYRGLVVVTRPQVIAPLGANAEIIAIGARGFTARQLLALPTKPKRLYRRVFESASAAQALDAVRTLDLYPIGPSLRAASFRALAMVRGIVVAGPARSLTGRSGVALGARDPSGTVEDELIIDPRSGAVLGERSITIDSRSDGLPLGTVRFQTAVITRTVTNAAGLPRHHH